MPTIRVERTPIRSLFLGTFGFDHLQLVFEPGAGGWLRQDHWYVIEGVRDPGPSGPTLGVQGADGQLTLARANAAAGAALTAKIGTPHQRGSNVIASGAAATRLWRQCAEHAAEIDGQQLRYIAYAPPGSARTTCNSSSVVATLLHRLGFEIGASLPAGTRSVPGIDTLIAAICSGTGLEKAHMQAGWPLQFRHVTQQHAEQKPWRQSWHALAS
ncbi:MAG: hypothetical protein Q7T86_04120 [Hyphomicrobiaceae bacterium]|nr:hypothetical protein [Hyphomicrobiaceae bacterium]